MAGWDHLRNLVLEEFTQSREEGKDARQLEKIRAEFEHAQENEERLAQIHQRLLSLPVLADFPHQEPSDLEGIRILRGDGPRQLSLNLSDEDLYDRLYGAWLGRCCGCALGKPVEPFMGEQNGLSSKDRIKTYLQAVSPDEYPLQDYFPSSSPASDRTGQVGCPLSCRDKIAFMESDDDIRYTVVGQIIMNRHGRDFTTLDVAKTWITTLPYSYCCTAETQAYRNVVEKSLIGWRQSEDLPWEWVSTHQNPYREWIGAQIRADSFGYAAPGNPELAAEFAWRDARLSHVKNGIYGEMFCAAMIAAAFALEDPRSIVEAALAEIPATSRLCKDIRATIAICDQHDCRPNRFEEVLDAIYAQLGHYHPVHTNNNAALVVAALLLGAHDFEKVITIAVMGGWDSDCNGATAGSIAGAMIGAKALPPKWTARLDDTLRSSVVDYHPIPISKCARRSVEIAKAVRS